MGNIHWHGEACVQGRGWGAENQLYRERCAAQDAPPTPPHRAEVSPSHRSLPPPPLTPVLWEILLGVKRVQPEHRLLRGGGGASRKGIGENDDSRGQQEEERMGMMAAGAGRRRGGGKEGG